MEEIKVMNKEKMLGPKLRFKGFDSEWKKQTLFDISENVSYGMNAAATEYDGIHKYIRITDIDVNTGEFKPAPLTSPLGEIDEKFKLKQGDIVFARTGASVGKSHLYNPKDGTLYFAGFLIKFSISKANPFFIYSLTLKEAYNKWVHIYSMRSGQPGLNAEEYKALKLNIPSLPEQQKIASFLSAVDEKIQQLTRKKELLEQYKKGVMQQLFSGKLRFRDEKGKAYPKWEEKRLGDFCESISSGKSKNSDDGGFPLYGSTGIIGNCQVCSHDGVFILIARVGANAGTINLVEGKFGVSDNTLIVICNEQLNIEYIYFYLGFYNLNKLIFGSGQPLITGGQLKDLNLNLPSLTEQKKIASYLSNIDTKIENVNNQIIQTQTFKKGLLQQMFV